MAPNSDMKPKGVGVGNRMAVTPIRAKGTESMIVLTLGTGVGGGIVLVPAFFYAFQTLGYGGPQLMQVCLATSLATIVVTSVRSVHAHNRRGAVDWAILRGWAPGIAVGAVLGLLIAARVSSVVLQLVFGIAAAIVGVYMVAGRSHWQLADALPTGPVRAILSPAVGLVSVLMGIGGGTLSVPILTAFSYPVHRAIGTAAALGLVIATFWPTRALTSVDLPALGAPRTATTGRTERSGSTIRPRCTCRSATGSKRGSRCMPC